MMASRRTRKPQGDRTMAAQAITAHDINALTGRTYPEFAPGVPSLRALLGSLLTRYEQHRRYRATVAELGRLSDHVLADIGVGRHEIGAIARTLSERAG
jgi:uncharacterized protein YjiS (DUF1127 family)